MYETHQVQLLYIKNAQGKEKCYMYVSKLKSSNKYFDAVLHIAKEANRLFDAELEIQTVVRGVVGYLNGHHENNEEMMQMINDMIDDESVTYQLQ